jgi:hypothetical protein
LTVNNVRRFLNRRERDSLKCSDRKIHDAERLMHDPLAYWWSLAEATTSIQLDELLGDLPRHSLKLKTIADPSMKPAFWHLQHAIRESNLLQKQRYRLVRDELLDLVRDAWKKCGGDPGVQVARS